MRPELTFWDHITLSLTLLFVVVYIVLKIKQLMEPSSNSCGNCSSSACSAPLTKKRLENKPEVHMVSVSSIKKSNVLKQNKDTRHST